jgi:hypothetical protein
MSERLLTLGGRKSNRHTEAARAPKPMQERELWQEVLGGLESHVSKK